MSEGSEATSSEGLDRALGVLWGKSDAAGRPNLLVQHLLDAAAVGELLWDGFLAPATRTRLVELSGGSGRSFLSLLCGLHDVGKATPAFQGKDMALAERVREAGLKLRRLPRSQGNWHHTLAGAVIVRRVLQQAGWPDDRIRWFWPLVAGHHGLVLGLSRQHNVRSIAQGDGEWVAVQDELVRRLVTELGSDLWEVGQGVMPTLALQLQLGGLVVMADWLASDIEHFPGVDQMESVSMGLARSRAASAWERVGLVGGWSPSRLAIGADAITKRFGLVPRPIQVAAIDLAETMPAPGLVLIEAPTGEGKTEAALAVTEILAGRFGADGVFVGMPTQATSDPMWERVTRWAQAIDPKVPIGLLHGRRQFNREWQKLLVGAHFGGIDEDEFGCDDGYGVTSRGNEEGRRSKMAPAEWFLGRKRGLLIPVTVGTVDNLLHAATRTRHVMLRQAALGGRVVLLDEVHSYDVYMAQFLYEILRWLGDARVPVVLLSATLAPQLRQSLIRAYAQGATGTATPQIPEMPVEQGYPSVIGTWVTGANIHITSTSVSAWRPDRKVEVNTLPEASDGDPTGLVSYLAQALEDGGCALVVRNTVGRAQRTFLAAKEIFGDDVVLLHSRLTAAERAERTGHVLDLLGPPGTGHTRPRRLVVVATQVAEQSFDVDVDVVMTDLAPADLLLQRVGRLHRHAREKGERPENVRTPRIVVTGVTWRGGGAPPTFPAGSTYVYGDHLLLRAAALVQDAGARGDWTLPGDVPLLVSLGYGDNPIGPEGWIAAEVAARTKWDAEQKRRCASAEQSVLLGMARLGSKTLDGLHERANAELDDNEAVSVVRDGPETVEVVLVRQDERGRYLTIDKRRQLGPQGDGVSDGEVQEEVIGSTICLPARPALTLAAKSLRPLPGWTPYPWLDRCRALVLGPNGSATLAGRRLSYDRELGLVDEPADR